MVAAQSSDTRHYQQLVYEQQQKITRHEPRIGSGHSVVVSEEEGGNGVVSHGGKGQGWVLSRPGKPCEPYNPNAWYLIKQSKTIELALEHFHLVVCVDRRHDSHR